MCHGDTCEASIYKSLHFGAMFTLPTTYHTAVVMCAVITPLTCRGAPCQFRWTAECCSCDSDMVMRRSMSSITGDPGSRNSLSVICSGTCPGIERLRHDTHIVVTTASRSADPTTATKDEASTHGDLWVDTDVAFAAHAVRALRTDHPQVKKKEREFTARLTNGLAHVMGSSARSRVRARPALP